MRRKKNTRIALITGIAAAAVTVVLAAALIASLARDAAEKRRLEEEKSRLDATLGVTTTVGDTHPSRLSGLQLLRAGVTDFNLFYFGDEAICGRGASSPLGTDPAGAPYRLKLRERLREEYAAPSHFAGRVVTNNALEPFSFAAGAEDFSGTYNPGDTVGATGLNYRLAIVAPSEANTAASGRGFASETETFLRSLRTRAEYCDVVLVIPHEESADSERAEVILALSEHYGCVTVDMREVFAGHPEYLHTEGEAAGLPNDAGHTAYAEAIAEAIATAARTASAPSPLPTERRYPY